MKISIITAFPDLFPGSLGVSIFKRAIENDIFSLNVIDIKEFTDKRIDDAPFGGGAGMILRPDVLARAIDYAVSTYSVSVDEISMLYTTPTGVKFDQSVACEFSKLENVIFVCGRYEGIDYRIIEVYNLRGVSIGDYVLAGGELAVMVILESALRLIPGVLGNHLSTCDESFAQHPGYLEYPQYTRPSCWRGCQVPDVLLSGHHAQIACWRLLKSKIK